MAGRPLVELDAEDAGVDTSSSSLVNVGDLLLSRSHFGGTMTRREKSTGAPCRLTDSSLDPERDPLRSTSESSAATSTILCRISTRAKRCSISRLDDTPNSLLMNRFATYPVSIHKMTRKCSVGYSTDIRPRLTKRSPHMTHGLLPSGIAIAEERGNVTRLNGGFGSNDITLTGW